MHPSPRVETSSDPSLRLFIGSPISWPCLHLSHDEIADGFVAALRTQPEVARDRPASSGGPPAVAPPGARDRDPGRRAPGWPARSARSGAAPETLRRG